MQISNHNLSAVVANNRLKTSENMVTQAMERLSTGLSINKSKDHPAHMALSNKLDMHINGMTEARKNADNASSMLQTTDGVLSQITSMLQRMRELAVQAATDTNTMTDRDHIQDEIEDLKKEIDRMSKDTEFNTKTLLDGTFDNRVFPSRSVTSPISGVPVPDMTRIFVSNEVPPGEYGMKVTPATQAEIDAASASSVFNGTSPMSEITEAQAGSFTINGYTVNIEAGDTYAEAAQKIQYGVEKGGGELDFSIGKAVIKSERYGEEGVLDIQIPNSDLANLLGFNPTQLTPHTGTDAVISDVTRDGAALNEVDFSMDGNRIIMRQPGGFEMDFVLNPDVRADSMVTLDVTDMGAFQAQIGANEGENVLLRIPRVDTEMMHLDDLDVSKAGGADRAIEQMDDALKYVSKIRSMIGAYDNRMEAVSDTLRQKNENLTNSVSKLRDTDMAAEMTNYTTANILVQAGTSVLSQCNDQPEMVLQILQ